MIEDKTSSPTSLPERVHPIPIEVSDIPKIIGSIQGSLTELTSAGKFKNIAERLVVVYRSGSWQITFMIENSMLRTPFGRR